MRSHLRTALRAALAGLLWAAFWILTRFGNVWVFRDPPPRFPGVLLTAAAYPVLLFLAAGAVTGAVLAAIASRRRPSDPSH